MSRGEIDQEDIEWGDFFLGPRSVDLDQVHKMLCEDLDLTEMAVV